MTIKQIRNVLCSVGVAAGMSFAQAGIAGGSDGMHQMTAKTLGQWGFLVGTGGNISIDAWSLSRGGAYTGPDGKQYSFNDWDASLSGNIHAAVGLADILDVGFNLPLYYEHANSDGGPAGKSGMWATSRGDLDAWLKIRAPFDENMVFSMAGVFDLYVPTGEVGVGVRPRHAWYLDGQGYTHPLTADEWAMGANLVFTVDLSKVNVPLRWNGHVGYVYAFGEGHANTLLYGTGLNYLPVSWMDAFVEFSGEFRVEDTKYPRDPMVDPMLLTPGLRFHLPAGIDLAVGLDVAVRALQNFTFDYAEEMKGCGNYVLNYVDEHNETSSYCYTSTPLYAGTALLTWRFGGVKNHDEDGDGVPDEKDQCAHTLEKAVVDSVGCPIDSDKDGAVDGYDVCPNTPAGVVIDSVGCPMDSDGDGVFDGLDKCVDTKAGTKVDSTGCEPVAQEEDFDKDGVSDIMDRCPNTPAGVKVDSTGCPEVVRVDTDKDGVMDDFDKCPDTKEGVAVDSTGCPMDTDKDGIPDDMDKCPNTKAGYAVDSTGCPLDADKDGVNDNLDKCPDTPAGMSVDMNGCPLDFDKDGIPDDFDKCPNTKEGIVVDSIGCALDTDKDGVPNGLDKCENTEKGISVDSTGCPLDTDHDGVPDHKDKCVYTLEGVKVDAKGCPLNKKEDLNQLKKGIQFESNSTKLTKDSYGTLNDIVGLLKKIPSANLEVQGHTDSVGKAEANKKLSQGRAQTVVDYLIKQGVDPSRLKAVGFGSEKPLAENGSRHGRKQNRRVELVPFEK